jgi:ATP-binding cassette subfamily F protein uup
MEARVLAAEELAAAKKAAMADPAVAADARRLSKAYEESQAAEAEVERLYARWAELEASVTA